MLVFHINESYLPGGFIGVDVFFVISGYIISKNILESRARKQFSLLSFYKRRIARLMPAALVTALLAYSASFYVFGYDRANELSGSFLSSVFWVSNIYFNYNIGYFDDVSSGNPFLHFWSLSVEEQFYIFWPITLVFLLGSRLVRHSVFAVVFIGLAAVIYFSDPQAMFYLLPARVFQFSLGAFIAVIHTRFGPVSSQSGLGRFPWAYAGLLAVIGSAFVTSGADYSFMVSAVLPAAGAALFLIQINHAHVCRVIGAAPMTWIGQRAYSLYLVHWPVMVFSTHYLGPHRPVFLDLVILLACFAIAELIYNYVETPFRFLGREKGRRTWAAVVRVVLPVTVLGALALTASFYPSAGPGLRPSEQERRAGESGSGPVTAFGGEPGVTFEQRDFAVLAAEIAQRRWAEGRIELGCHLPYGADIERYDADACLPLVPEGSKVLLIGDSYGAETIPLLETWIAPDRLISAVSGGCVPIYPEPGSASRPDSCQQLNRFRYEDVVPRSDVAAVVLVSNWRHWRRSNMERTIDYLTSLEKQVFVIGVRPQFSDSVPDLLSSPIGGEIFDDLSRYHTFDPHARNEELRAVVEGFEAAHFIDVLPTFCPGACPAFFGDNELIYSDAAHTGPVFARFLSLELEERQPEVLELLRAAVDGSSQVSSPAEARARLRLRLECEALNADLPEVVRHFDAEFADGEVSLRLGSPEGDRYESWTGQVSRNGDLVIEGEYIEGLGGVKPVSLEGRLVSGELTATGTRGARRCRVFSQ